MIVVTVNRDGLERGTTPQPIEVHWADGQSEAAAEIRLLGDVRVVYRPDTPRQDGARVWIEADNVVFVR